MNKKRLILIATAISIVAISGFNGFFLQKTYSAYKKSSSATNGVSKNLIKVTPSTSIVGAKQSTVSSGRTGSQIGTGTYTYEERDHSKLNVATSSGQLTLATQKTNNVHFLLAENSGVDQSSATVSSGWTVGTINQDTIWQPASCASKPTYLIGGRYIFIDDGKEKATDKYTSYLVFDMVSNKFRYFGGNNFTAQQGDTEHILSIQNENGSIVFYIDHSDVNGPLAGSTTFKHAALYAPKYITRRVIDANTLKYTDYNIPYTVPDGLPYYYIDAGTDFANGQIATLSSDNSQISASTYYPGVITNNTLTFQPKSLDPMAGYPEQTNSSANLDQLLTTALPAFVAGFDAQTAQTQKHFTLSKQGTQNDLQFLIASQSYSADGNLFDSPFIYNTTTQKVDTMMIKPVLSSYVGGNYVPLGVF